MKKTKTRIQVEPDQAKKAEELGARYDGRMKSYYVPQELPIALFTEYIPLPIELVPSNNWQHNVRSEFSNEWSSIRRVCYKKAGYRCEKCGGVGERHPVECHEVWSYDIESGVQTLVRLIALCPLCHKSQHYGYAVLSGMEKEVRTHLKEMNRWTDDDLDKYLNEVFHLFDVRSERSWRLNTESLQYYR